MGGQRRVDLMSQAKLVIFDDGAGRFGPLTDLRAVFELRTGAQTTWRRIERVFGRTAVALFAHRRLQDVIAQRRGAAVNRLPDGNDLLMVNGRWSACTAVGQAAQLSIGQALVQGDGQLLAARLNRQQADRLVADGFDAPAAIHAAVDGNVLIERPWDIIAQLEKILTADLQASDLPVACHDSSEAATVLGEHDFYLADSARLDPMVVIDCRGGPVVIDRDAKVGAFAVISGPCYIGSGSRVAPHALIQPNTVLGPCCVVGGEVSWTIIHGRSNKAHAGHLGHCLVGQWVNLGADTTVSNLKNTYGNVRVQLERDAPAEDSGAYKLGAVIGDYVRTAIGCRLVTGSCIGTGTSLALSGFAPKYAGRFEFHTDEAVQRYDIEKFLVSAKTMMARRGCDLSEHQQLLLRSVAESHP